MDSISTSSASCNDLNNIVNQTISVYDPKTGDFISSEDKDGDYGSCGIYGSSYAGSIPFSVQDALLYSEPSNGPQQLTSTGCGLRTNNGLCNDTCVHHPELIFGDPTTLANCFSYIKIAGLLAAGNLTTNAEQMADQYSIQRNQTIVASIKNTISSCIQAYCEGIADCRRLNETSDGLTDLDSTTICDFVAAPILGDISGIGIYISYWLQSGIALVAFVLIKLYDVWLYYILVAVLSWPLGYNRATQKAQSVRKKARELALPRLATALVDFQKTQCYFMQAVQIAAIITIRTGRLEANNLQQLYNTCAFVHIVSISGFLPVTFVLLCLQSVGKRSWYLTILSTVTVTVSAATLSLTSSFHPSEHDMHYLKNIKGSQSECGNKDPTVWCLDPYIFYDTNIGIGSTGTGDSAVTILIFCIFILIIMILETMQILKTQFFQRHKKRLLGNRRLRAFIEVIARSWTIMEQSQTLFVGYKPPQPPQWLTKRLLLPFRTLLHSARLHWKRYFVNILYSSVWGFYIFFFTRSMDYFATFARGNDLVDRNWTFGQIVGITIWAEPLIEFLYLEIKGMNASNYRFLPPWIIARNDNGFPDSTIIDRRVSEELDLRPLNTGYLRDETASVDRSRSGYAFAQDQYHDYDHERQHQADLMEQRLL